MKFPATNASSLLSIMQCIDTALAGIASMSVGRNVLLHHQHMLQEKIRIRAATLLHASGNYHELRDFLRLLSSIAQCDAGLHLLHQLKLHIVLAEYLDICEVTVQEMVLDTLYDFGVIPEGALLVSSLSCAQKWLQRVTSRLMCFDLRNTRFIISQLALCNSGSTALTTSELSQFVLNELDTLAQDTSQLAQKSIQCGLPALTPLTLNCFPFPLLHF